MRFNLAFFIILTGSATLASILPTGTYQGQRTFLAGDGTTYTATETIVVNVNGTADDAMMTLTNFSNGAADSAVDFNVTHSATGGGFSLTVNGTADGTGYCIQNSCHILASTLPDGTNLEETIIFNPVNNTARAVGSVTASGGSPIPFETALSKIN